MRYKVYLKDEESYHSEYENINFMTHGWVELLDKNRRCDYFPKEAVKYIAQVRSE